MKPLAAALAALLVAGLLALVPASPASADYEGGTWGSAETIYYWPSAGQWKGRIDDHYVQAHWLTSQANVSECTYVKVRSANTGIWYSDPYWRDCGGAVRELTIALRFPIDKVRIESKDNRGRWRYYTIEG